MNDSTVVTQKVTMHARVFRIAWDRKPWFVPTSVWLWLGKKRVPGTGRWQDLGEIANSEKGTASAEFISNN